MNAAVLIVMGCLVLGGVGCAGESSDARAGESELRDDAPAGQRIHAKLQALAPKVSLGFLGEDSGSDCSASFRRGPASELSARKALRLFQFDVDAQLASDEFSFENLDEKAAAAFWTSFLELQFGAEETAAAKEIHALFTSAAVKGLAIMIPADRIAFGASAFLIAHVNDGSLVALRGSIGGMTL